MNASECARLSGPIQAAREFEIVWTRSRAMREYLRHGLDTESLDKDLGAQEQYSAADVYRELGY